MFLWFEMVVIVTLFNLKFVLFYFNTKKKHIFLYFSYFPLIIIRNDINFRQLLSVFIEFLALYPGLPPFAGAKTGQKNIRVPPLIFCKYIFIQIWDKICSFSHFEGIFSVWFCSPSLFSLFFLRKSRNWKLKFFYLKILCQCSCVKNIKTFNVNQNTR